ncbi:hypothetical protein HK101_011352 [Irineochytrium annulatum]|nr:hypothetical protein HK101_011352 [Irineochytrium annulatum]
MATKYEVTTGTISRKVNEMFSYIEEYGMGGETDELMVLNGPGTPKDKAEALLHKAREASSAKRKIQLAKTVLEVYPDSSDAYLILAEESDNESDARAYLKAGIAAGERELGDLFFEKNKGHFWGLQETRPYIRVCKSYAESCWFGGDTQEAAQTLERLLELNTEDNTGARYLLAAVYLYSNQLKQAEQLMAKYGKGGASTAFAYDQIILEYKKNGITSQLEKLYRVARGMNKHVPDYLLGETTDIVEKEMYTFDDKGNRSMTLRPEGTAGVVRAYVENKIYGEPDVSKLYYIGPMFRYERPQAGRQRQFHQFGVEAIGALDPAIDAEVIALGYQLCVELGLKDVKVEINSVGNSTSRAEYRETLLGFLRPMKDSLCKDCQSRMERNPLRVLDCKVDQDKFVGAPSILDSLDEESLNHFVKLQAYLDDFGVDYAVNNRLVRGLDYYTLTAFELKAQGIGAIDTVGGGGRYNGLVGDIGGPDQPGIGFGIGLERIQLILEHQNIEVTTLAPLDVYFVALGEAADREVNRLLFKIRQSGLSGERDYLGRKMKAQMKSADRFKSRYTAILGDDELERGEIALKSMDTGEQQTVKLDDLVAAIRESK